MSYYLKESKVRQGSSLLRVHQFLLLFSITIPYRFQITIPTKSSTIRITKIKTKKENNKERDENTKKPNPNSRATAKALTRSAHTPRATSDAASRSPGVPRVLVLLTSRWPIEHSVALRCPPTEASPLSRVAFLACSFSRRSQTARSAHRPARQANNDRFTEYRRLYRSDTMKKKNRNRTLVILLVQPIRSSGDSPVTER